MHISRGITISYILVMLLFGLTISANAELIDRGGGLIYDTDLNITWLADIQYFGVVHSWEDYLNTASDLVYYDSVRDVNWDDWRLPLVMNSEGSDPCLGYDCTDSEMAHLFYDELGGTAGTSILSTSDPDLNLFMNVDFFEAGPFWSSTLYDSYHAVDFHFDSGISHNKHIATSGYALMVRDGDVVVVPEPISTVLFITGGATLAAVRFRKRISIK